MKVKKTWLCFLLILLLLPYTLTWSANHNDPSKKTIFFYNPETNINNFVSLKISFDTYLSKFGDYQFQPYNDKDLFEKSIPEQQQGIYLLSSWHYQYLPGDIDLHPVMVGVLNGQSTQKKILVVKQKINNVLLLKGKTIASSGNKEYTRKLLMEMLGDKNDDILKTITLILVPKDIDALMAISYGMASAALTSTTSFENLKNINQKQFNKLSPLVESQHKYFTLAVLPPTDTQGTNKLIDILEKMGINPEGEIRLRMLGLDGWRKLSPQEKILLKQQRGNGL